MGLNWQTTGWIVKGDTAVAPDGQKHLLTVCPLHVVVQLINSGAIEPDHPQAAQRRKNVLDQFEKFKTRFQRAIDQNAHEELPGLVSERDAYLKQLSFYGWIYLSHADFVKKLEKEGLPSCQLLEVIAARFGEKSPEYEIVTQVNYDLMLAGIQNYDVQYRLHELELDEFDAHDIGICVRTGDTRGINYPIKLCANRVEGMYEIGIDIGDAGTLSPLSDELWKYLFFTANERLTPS